MDSESLALPIEVLLEIFTHSKGKDLKDCMLLSKEIRESILRSKKLMSKLRLRVDDWYKKPENFQFIEQYGQSFEKLTLKAGFDDQVELIKILKLFPNVEFLKLDRAFLRKITEDPINLELSKLTRLKISDTFGPEIFDFLVKVFENKTNLQWFKIKGKEQQQFHEDLAKTLLQQVDLKELILKGHYNNCTLIDSFFRAIRREDINFQLKTLRLRGEFMFSKSFGRFMRSQGLSIVEFELVTSNTKMKALKFMMKELKSLKSMKIFQNFDFRKRDVEQMSEYKMAGVTSLSLNDYLFSKDFEPFPVLFPNVEKLHLSYDISDECYELLGRFKNLQELTMEMYENPSCELPKLRKWTINDMEADQELWGLWKYPNLEELTIKSKSGYRDSCLFDEVFRAVVHQCRLKVFNLCESRFHRLLDYDLTLNTVKRQFVISKVFFEDYKLDCEAFISNYDNFEVKLVESCY